MKKFFVTALLLSGINLVQADEVDVLRPSTEQPGSLLEIKASSDDETSTKPVQEAQELLLAEEKAEPTEDASLMDALMQLVKGGATPEALDNQLRAMGFHDQEKRQSIVERLFAGKFEPSATEPANS